MLFKRIDSFLNMNHTVILQGKREISHKNNCVFRQRRMCRTGWGGGREVEIDTKLPQLF